MELFSLKIIQTIITYMWSLYKQKIIARLFIPFLVYFLIFVFTITSIYFASNDQ